MSALANRFVGLFLILGVGLAYLGYHLAIARPESTDRTTTDADASLAPNNPGAAESGPPVHQVRFLESRQCALCHSNSRAATAMRDARDRPVAPYDLWQASMMANSSRDPFWRAVLSAEVLATPSKKALIEEKCTRCHTPMAAPVPESPPGEVLAILHQDDQRAQLGMDGVSCTVCHQITDKNLGTEASFTGHFELNTEGKIFGPHADPFPMPMQRHVGYTPTHSPHILKSGLCATCHTVNTTPVDPQGQATSEGEFHEQSPYLEWRNSVFNNEVAQPLADARSCQACHMPTTDEEGNPIMTRLAHNPGGRDFPFLQPRQPFGRHAFLGGNTLLKRILRDHAQQLGVEASREAFNQSIRHTQEFLETQTASIQVQDARAMDGKLLIPVTVTNLSGHKLPTAYPSRRVWIHLVVTDAAGNTVFESGRHNAAGQLVTAAGTILPSELAGGPVHPHRASINDSDQVQVYETIMGDAQGAPTFTLLRGATYVKDNRLLPRGWRADHADGPATRPYGIGNDDNFSDGGDRLTYEVALPGPGEYSISASLRFQVISPRHAAELFQFQTAEVAAFQAMFDQADRSPETLATTSVQVVADDH